MFSEQIRIYGKHANIIKKYSLDKQASETNYFTVTKSCTSDSINTYIFKDMLECYMVAAILGIINDRKSDVDKTPATPANIFAEKVIKNKITLERIFKHMVFSRYDELNIDQKIKKAFELEHSNNDKDIFDSYVRGGLEIIDETFNKSQTIEDIAKTILNLLDHYSIED